MAPCYRRLLENFLMVIFTVLFLILFAFIVSHNIHIVPQDNLHALDLGTTLKP